MFQNVAHWPIVCKTGILLLSEEITDNVCFKKTMTRLLLYTVVNVSSFFWNRRYVKLGYLTISKSDMSNWFRVIDNLLKRENWVSTWQGSRNKWYVMRWSSDAQNFYLTKIITKKIPRCHKTTSILSLHTLVITWVIIFSFSKEGLVT